MAPNVYQRKLTQGFGACSWIGQRLVGCNLNQACRDTVQVTRQLFGLIEGDRLIQEGSRLSALLARVFA